MARPSRASRARPRARGYTRLADVRYEARDTQHLVGRLVDEAVADPGRAPLLPAGQVLAPRGALG